MKRFFAPVSLLVALAVAAVCVGTAAGNSTNFTASYKGKVSESVNGSAVTATPKGTGKATVVGKGKLTGKVAASTSNPPCTPLSGPGTLSGKKSTLKLNLLTKKSQACAAGQDTPNDISFTGYAKVTGGTGALKHAKGTLRFTGHYDRGSGAFNVKLTGTLKY